MTFLSEDPTYLAGFLILVAGAFLMALKVTQHSKSMRQSPAKRLVLEVFVLEDH